MFCFDEIECDLLATRLYSIASECLIAYMFQASVSVSRQYSYSRLYFDLLCVAKDIFEKFDLSLVRDVWINGLHGWQNYAPPTF